MKVDLTSVILFILFTTAVIVSNLIISSVFDWSSLKASVVSFFCALLFMIMLVTILGFIGKIMNKRE